MGDSAGRQWLSRELAQLALAAACVLPALASAALPFVDTDQVIVRVRGPGVPTPDAANTRGAALAARLSSQAEPMSHRRVMGDGSHVMKLFRRMPAAAIEAMGRRFARDDEIVEIIPDRIAFPALTPNDPQLALQWALTASQGVNVLPAWDISTGSPNLIIGIVDTGRLDHADLAGRWIGGYDFIGDTNRSNDGDGRDANAADGGDWVTLGEAASGPLAGCPVTDSRWHGTAMAGIIAAIGNNGLGIAGLNWNSKILPVRVVGKCGGYTSDIVDGLRWAAGIPVPGVPDNPNTADVVNVSLSAVGACDPAWQSAINELTNLAIPVIAAAGNGAANASTYSPGNCFGVITVGAVDRNGRLPGYANYGAAIAVSAPGGTGNATDAVLTTFDSGITLPLNDSVYASVNGTSIAAAQVTGIASLMLSMNPTLLPSQVKSILQDNARAFTAVEVAGEVNCNASLCGSGIADAARSLALASAFGSGPPAPMVAAGRYNNALGLRSDGAVFQWWMSGSVEQRGDVSGVRGIALSWGTDLALAVRQDGTLWAWTRGPYIQTSAVQLMLSGVVAASTKGFHWLALKSDGTVWGAGDNGAGQLGDGTMISRNGPVQAAGLTNVVGMSAGGSHSLAVKSDGTVWGWGDNSQGQVGDGTSGSNRLAPVQVVGLANVVAVSAGGFSSLALRSDATVWQWGSGINTATQVPGLTNVVAISAGTNYWFALKGDGTLWAWGSNGGQLGDGTTVDRATPVQVVGLTNIVAMSAGQEIAFAVKSDGSVYVWGYGTPLAFLVSGPGNVGTLNLNLSASSFTPQVNAALSQGRTSNTIVINGIANGSAISVTGGQYRIDGGAFTATAGTINAGQSVTLNMTASANCNTTTSATVTIAGVDRSFSVTTIACDTTPDEPGGLGVAANVEPGSVITSGSLYITGINAPIPISVVGGQYSIQCTGTFTSAAGTIAPDQNVCVRMTASASEDTVSTATLTVGPFSRIFTVITRSSPAFSVAPMVAAGRYNNALGLRSDGAVFQWWMSGSVEQRGDVSGVRGIALSWGTDLALAVRQDGTLWAWTRGPYIQTSAVQLMLSGVVAASTKGFHWLALKSDGTVWGAGDNGAGQLGDGTMISRNGPVQAAGLTNVVGMSAGGSHSLAVKSDGTVWGWGDNSQGQVGDGTSGSNRLAPVQVVGLANVVAVSAGGFSSLALRSDATVWQWGSGINTATQVPGLTNVVAISAGTNYWFALKGDGTLWAWGSNGGQLGDGTTVDRATPVQVVGLTNIVAMSAGQEIAFAVKSDGSVYVWGYGTPLAFLVSGPGNVGTLNLNLSASSFTPQVNAALSQGRTSNTIVINGIANGSAISVTGGQYRIDGGAFTATAGTINAGQSVTLNMTASANCNTTTSATVTIAGVDRSFSVTTIACDTTPDEPGGLGVAANVEPGSVITSGSLYITGINAPIPISVVGGQYSIQCTGTFTSAAGTIAPDQNVCVRMTASASEDTVSTATLTVGPFSRIFTVITRSSPAFSVAPMVAAGRYNNALGLRSDGAVFQWWMSGSVEQRGDVSGVRGIALSWGTDLALAVRQDGTLWAWTRGPYIQTSAVQLMLSGVVAASTKGFHWLALKSDGTVWGAGDNGAGQLGDGTMISRNGPVQAAGLTNVVGMSAGGSHSLAVKSDGTVWGWGDNSQGQVGDGTSGSNRLAPVQVVGLANVVAVSAGGFSSLALRSDATVWQWGSGINTATQVPGLTNVVAISAGTNYWFALKGDGTLWAWGSNGGQLGDGTTVDRATPVQVVGLTNIVAMSAGQEIAFAVKSDGSVYVWGYGTPLAFLVSGPGNVGTLNLNLSASSFTPQVNAALSQGRTSNTIVINGIANGSAISVTGGQYRIDGGAFTATAGTINAGQSVTLNMTASANCNTTTSATVTIAGVDRSFSVTTIACDTTPDEPGGLGVAANVEPGSVITSGSLYITGINAPIPISVVGGQYSIQCTGTFTSAAGTIAPDQNVCVRMTASASEDTVSTATLTVGPFSRIFTVITRSSPAFSVAPMVAAGRYNNALGLRSDGAVFQWWMSGSVEQRGDVSGVRGIALSWGTDLALAVRQDGTLWAWTRGPYIQTSAVQLMLSGVVAASTKGFHWLALKSDGTVWGAGDNGAGQLGDGTMISRNGPVQAAGLTNVVGMSAGGSHSLAVKSDGTVWGWGDNSQGQVGDGTSGSNRLAPVQVVGLANVVAVSAGGFSSLALRSDATVWQWGSGINTATQVPGLTNVVAISAGTNYWFALKGDGTLWAWGSNGGQLGDGTTVDRATPVQVVGLTNIVAMSAGQEIAFAVKSDGSVYVWGYGTPLAFLVSGPGNVGTLNLVIQGLRPDPFAFLSVFGAPLATSIESNPITVTGLGSGASSPITVSGGEISINGGAYSSASSFVTNGSVVRTRLVSAAGHETLAASTVTIGGATGNASTFFVYTQRDPVLPKANPAVALGESHSLLLNSQGNILAFGYNGNGQLGNGSTFSTPVPTLVAGIAGITRITSGANHVLALRSDGTISSWGHNVAGQLGDGTQTTRLTAVTVSGLGSVTAISAGRYHSLALRADATVWAWGLNNEGQVGDNSNAATRVTPVQIPSLSSVVAIAAGGRHSLALLANGSVLAWGANDSGQLGDGTTTLKRSPVLVSISNVVAVAAGESHSLAIKNDGTVWAWGANGFGQLGDGTVINRVLPIAVASLGSGVGLIACGEKHSLAVKAGGAMYAWGNNGNSQLGNGVNANSQVPVLLTTPSAVVSISGGARHSAAIDANRQLYVWGDNFFGQVGNKSGNFNPNSGSLNVLRGDTKISEGVPPSGGSVGTGGNAGSSLIDIEGQGGAFDFGSFAAGASITRNGRYQNQSGTDNIESISLSVSGNGFSLASTNCPTTLTPASECNFTLAFNPGGASSYTGELVVTSNVVGSPERRSLSGIGVATAALTLEKSFLSFPPQLVGSSSTVANFAITNTGNATLVVSSVTGSVPAFSATHNCASVAPGASCNLAITFTPSAPNTQYGYLILASNAAGSPQTLTVSGTGVATTAIPAPTLTGVVSRKTHAAAGTFDLTIDTAQPLGGAVTVEPRAEASHKVVFQFNTAITSAGTASVTPTGSVSTLVNGSTVEVTVSGVPNNMRITVSLANTNNAGGNVSASLAFAVGDTDSTRTVDATDLTAIKAKAGETVDASNFRRDLNLTGAITASDILIAKGRLGTSVP